MGKTFDIGLNDVVTKNFDEKVFYPFKRQPRKIVKHTQTICRLLTTNSLSLFDYFVGLSLKG